MTEHRRPLYRGRAGLSDREYAAHAGISRGAVQKARASGRLVLHADGSIDAAASDARRAQATDPSMQRGRHEPSLRPVGAGAIGAIQESVGQAHEALVGVVPYLDVAKWGPLAVTLIGIGVMLWARVDDRRKGLR
jgi:hypothetical protein